MSEREPGAVWGGWWFWEPPPGKIKETRGLFDRLTPEQKAAALAYRGPESHGDPGLPKRRS